MVLYYGEFKKNNDKLAKEIRKVKIPTLIGVCKFDLVKLWCKMFLLFQTNQKKNFAATIIHNNSEFGTQLYTSGMFSLDFGDTPVQEAFLKWCRRIMDLHYNLFQSYEPLQTPYPRPLWFKESHHSNIKETSEEFCKFAEEFRQLYVQFYKFIIKTE